jgi:hypothetical protein
VARENLRAVEVAAIGDGIERLRLQNSFRLFCNARKLCPIRAAVRHLVRHDQMMLGIDRDLHIVAHHTRAAAACRHRATVGICERDLLVGRGEHLFLVSLKLPHFVFQLRKLLFEPRRLRYKRLRWLLPVGRVKLAQISRHALLKLRTPPLHLRAREVLVVVVDCLELAAVDGDARRGEKTHLAAELDKARAHLAKGATIVLAKIGNRLVVRDQPTQQPHDFDVAARFPFQPPARLYSVEVAVDVELQQNRKMVRRPTGRRRLHSIEPKLGQIERIDEGVNHANRIALVNEIIEAFSQ